MSHDIRTGAISSICSAQFVRFNRFASTGSLQLDGDFSEKPLPSIDPIQILSLAAHVAGIKRAAVYSLAVGHGYYKNVAADPINLYSSRWFIVAMHSAT
jgi:hypothetical protein